MLMPKNQVWRLLAVTFGATAQVLAQQQVPCYVWGSSIPTDLKTLQFSPTLSMDAVLSQLVQRKNRVVVFEHEHMPIQDMMNLKRHFNNINNALDTADDLFYSTALPRTNEYGGIIVETSVPSDVKNVKCQSDSSCIILVRVDESEENTNEFVGKMLGSFENIYGQDNFIGVWTSKGVRQTEAANKSLRQYAVNKKYGLNRNTRSATIGSSANENYGSGKIVNGGPPGYDKDYRYLTPAIIMTLVIMFVFVGATIIATTLMASIQAPVRFQDPKIPIVGKEGN